ncbi:MAG: DUF1624 domain-containing protein [Burkholderiales bacterium]
MTRWARTQRFERLDALRGVAIVWMTAYHLCFDLNHFGWLQENFFRDPFWTWQRTAIVSLFLFCAGLGQAVALEQEQGGAHFTNRFSSRFTSRFWWRWSQVALAALLVSAGSYLMYPKTFIYFGVLHGIALMLLVARLTAGWGRWLWLCGALAISLKYLALAAHSAWPELAFLNGKGWNWLGLISAKPYTEDYVPLLPWLGVLWWGLAAGQWLLRRRPHWLGAGVNTSAPGGPPAPVAAISLIAPLQRGLSWLGRHSLAYYLLHQPVLIGALMLLKWAVST